MKNNLSLMLSLSLALSATAHASKANDTLDVGYERVLLTLNPYASTNRLPLVLGHNWGDTLVVRDPASGKLVPHLATSWKKINTTTLELKLRTGVKFHNGESFNADSVVATFNYAVDPKSPNPGADILRWIDKAEKVNDTTVRLISKKPAPVALETLASSAIMLPAKYLKEAGATGLAKNPVGTGPYRFVSWKANTMTFKANDSYFGGAKSKARVSNLVINMIPEESSRVAALTTGELSLVRPGGISSDQAPLLARNSELKIAAAEILRFWFLQMDSVGRSGVDYFKNPMVRQAVYMAINRDEIEKVLLGGYAQTIDTPCNPAQFGCDVKAAKTYKYDPAAAKKLLAEAGYPNGFSVDLYGYREQSVAQALSGYLGKIGIKVNLKWYGGQYDVASQSLAAGKVPLWFGAWGANSVYDASTSMDPFFSKSGEFVYIKDPAVQNALANAGVTISSAARAALFKSAIARITDQAYWVPMFSGKVIAGMRANLNWAPSNDEIDRYWLASWK